MDVEDAENEASVPSLILNSLESQQNEVLSPEDLAWADSCLIEDSDISESSWIPLKNALLEIISSQPQSFNTDRRADTETPPSRGKKKIESNVELNEQSPEPSSIYSVLPLSTAAERRADDIPDNEKTETLPSLTFHGNPFLPTYNEDLNVNETVDLGFNMDSSTFDVEHASENIFKIWDLDFPSEEGELVKQLDKALAENSFPTTPSSFDDSRKWEDLKEGLLGDLVAGIADMSLNQNSS